MEAFFHTIDALANFPNTLGMLVTDGLINNHESQNCIPVIGAVVRDLKMYMKIKNEITGQRILPLGFGAARSGARDKAMLDYLSSGDETEDIDFGTASILPKSFSRP